MTQKRADVLFGTLHGHGQPEPIGLEYVAGALAANGFDCAFRSPLELTVRAPGSPRRLSFLSALTSEYPAAGVAAEAAGKRGETTVLGGYHACGSPDEAVAGPFDYVVTGEGEDVGVAIARALLAGDTDALDGFRCGSGRSPKLLHGPRIGDLDAIPFPLRSEERLGTYILYDLMWPPTSCQHNTAIVLTSRGCQHNCAFCASSTVWGCGVRCRSHDNILRELRDLKTRFDTNTFVIIDQSLGQDKDWTIGLCEAIQDADLGMNWYHQSNLTIERDVLKAMAAAGCTKIGFGLEGLSPRAVERLKPPNPTDFDEINAVFDYCTSLGLFVKAYAMIGFPWETEETIREYLEWVPRLRANQVKISYMTPFPGTAYWETHKDQLVTRDWREFDTVRMPVVRNPHIGVEQYHRIRADLFRAFYGSDAYAEVTRRMLDRFPRSVDSFAEFAGYLREFGMISGKEPWLEWTRQTQAAHEARSRRRGWH